MLGKPPGGMTVGPGAAAAPAAAALVSEGGKPGSVPQARASASTPARTAGVTTSRVRMVMRFMVPLLQLVNSLGAALRLWRCRRGIAVFVPYSPNVGHAGL